MTDLHQQRWVKSMNWENDPRLLPGFERFAARIGTSVPKIREVFLSARKCHANYVGISHLDQYAPTPPMTWLAEAGGVSRRRVRIVYDGLLDIGFLQQRTEDGWFRPNPTLLDELLAWKAAQQLLDAVPEVPSDKPGQTLTREGQVGHLVPLSATPLPLSATPRPPLLEGSNGHGVAVEPPDAAPGAGFGGAREAPEKSNPPGGDRDRDREAAVKTLPTVSGRRTPNPTADPSQGTDPLPSPPVPSASGDGDPAFTQDGGPCADCGYPISAICEELLRDRRAVGEPTRWSHGEIPDPCGP